MKRLRIVLILAILFVGLFPDPNELVDESFAEGCPNYDSLFVTIYGGWKYCAASPGRWVFILIPGSIPRNILNMDTPSITSPSFAIPWPFDSYLFSD